MKAKSGQNLKFLLLFVMRNLQEKRWDQAEEVLLLLEKSKSKCWQKWRNAKFVPENSQMIELINMKNFAKKTKKDKEKVQLIWESLGVLIV